MEKGRLVTLIIIQEEVGGFQVDQFLGVSEVGNSLRVGLVPVLESVVAVFSVEVMTQGQSADKNDLLS